MRRALSGLVSAMGVLLVLSAPAAARAQRGAKPDSAKPASKAPAKMDQKTDQSKQQAGKAPGKSDQTKQSAATAGAKPDTGGAVSVSESGGKGQMTIMRELFTYVDGGRRDPMLSLVNTAQLRPLLSEIECIGILYDETGRNSEAVMRSLDQKKTYRVKVGQTLGRATVAQITRREVVFTIDEYGFARQYSLPVKPDTTRGGVP